MREATLAEVILSLVMTPERAAATVGDLREERISRAKFWLAAARVLAAGLARDLVASPLTKVRLALWAWLVQGIVGYLLYTGLYFIMPMRPVGPNAFDTSLWTPRITVVALCTIVPLLIGWGVGKGSRAREVATAFLTAPALVLAIPRFPVIGRPWQFCLIELFVAVGATLYRFSQRSARPLPSAQ